MVVAAIFLTLPLCLTFAALNDLFNMTIPNRIPLVLLLGFIVVAPFTGMGWQTLAMSLLAAAIVFLPVLRFLPPMSWAEATLSS
ncbi:membrane hypothetical protein [Agrobacterium salinitolerans str. Hayward 0363]|nr:membrane hypothetical protein [Agrobacterium salinitolerans str. Hayward 0363]